MLIRRRRRAGVCTDLGDHDQHRFGSQLSDVACARLHRLTGPRLQVPPPHVHTFGGPPWTSYSFSVDASHAAGNRSVKATVSASTTACPPPGDTQPPSAPSSFQSTASTVSSVTLSWGASTDNVGVTGYGVYVGGTLNGSTASTSYTVSGLTCGTSYGFAVDAADAAGNRSAKVSASASTAACGGGGGPSANLWVDTNKRQATAGSYVDAPTRSPAYAAAQCGDTSTSSPAATAARRSRRASPAPRRPRSRSPHRGRSL